MKRIRLIKRMDAIGRYFFFFEKLASLYPNTVDVFLSCDSRATNRFIDSLAQNRGTVIAAQSIFPANKGRARI